MPVAIKDDADVAGEVTAWGTDAYGPPKAVDSDVVTRLRAAGAIVIGKTHVPEMTLWPWTASATWGVTRNPWDAERTPGGSSGGSAVAAATGMCGVALGSDGGGSIRYPSALTGLFGIKPQRDRIPLGPDHHDAWNGLTAYGPLARTVATPRSSSTRPPTICPTVDSRAALDAPLDRCGSRCRSSRRPARSLVSPANVARRSSRRPSSCARSATRCSSRRSTTASSAMGNVSVRYLAALHEDVAIDAAADRLERNTRRLAALGGRLPKPLGRERSYREGAIASRMNRSFDRADVVLTPMAGGPPPHITEVVDRGLMRSLYRSNAAWAAPWNAIGQPAASVPAGFDADGLPLAVQLCARPATKPRSCAPPRNSNRRRPWADRVPPVDSPDD